MIVVIFPRDTFLADRMNNEKPNLRELAHRSSYILYLFLLMFYCFNQINVFLPLFLVSFYNQH